MKIALIRRIVIFIVGYIGGRFLYEKEQENING